MQIPTVKLSDISKNAVKNILEASKNKTSIGEQMKMANYYAYLHSEKVAKTDKTNYAKILLGK